MMETYQIIYKIQCFTYWVAQNLLGDHSNVTRVDMSSSDKHPDPKYYFRAHKWARTPQSQALRDNTAKAIKSNRDLWVKYQDVFERPWFWDQQL